MRLVARFAKGEEVKYISHLDTMRTFQRAFRRAGIPVAFSRGFNPHPRLAFAAALAVGITSEGEYMDVILEEYLEAAKFCLKMNEVLPAGIEILDAAIVDDNAPSLMSVVERADYIVKIFKPDLDICNDIENFLKQKAIYVKKKSKKGSKIVNIRDMIYRFELCTKQEDGIVLEVSTGIGDRKNLKPEILLEAFFGFIDLKNYKDIFLKIHRLNMFLYQNGRWITPLQLGKV